MFFNPFHGVGIKHFAPDVRVIPCGISSGKGMREVWAAIPRWHWRKIDAGFAQCRCFKSHRILGYFRWVDLMPGLIEQRCGKVLSRLITLVEFFRRNYLVEECLWYRFSGLVMFGEVLQHLRPTCPHLVNLRRILDKIARHTGSAKPRILHI